MDGRLIEIYKQLNNVLNLRDGWLGLITDLLRLLGSGVIASLTFLNDFAENLVDKFLTLNNFYASGPVKTFMDDVRPIVWGLFGIAILILGIQFIFNKVQKRNEVVMNIILAICFIVIIPDLMTNLGNITNKGIQAIKPSTQSLSSNMVKSNVLDIKYYADKDFQFSDGKGSVNSPPRPRMKGGNGTDDFTYANQLSVQTIPYINYTETIDSNSASKLTSETAKKLLTNKMVVNGNGFAVEALKGSDVPMTNLGTESYYRWHVNWMTLIVSLSVVTIALVISLIKIGRITFDLAFHQIFGMFVAVTDLSGGQRTKKILAEIINSFAVLFIMVVILKMYILYSSWVNELNGSIGALGALILLIAGAWAIIDAPDIVQRVLGIDAGLRDGWGAMMGAYAATKTASTAAKGTIKTTGKIAKGGMSAFNYGRGVLSGKGQKTPGEMSKIPGTSQKGQPNQDSTFSGAVQSIPNQSQEQGVQGVNGGQGIPMQGSNVQGSSNQEKSREKTSPKQAQKIQSIPNQQEKGGNGSQALSRATRPITSSPTRQHDENKSSVLTFPNQGNLAASPIQQPDEPEKGMHLSQEPRQFNSIPNPLQGGNSSPISNERAENGLWNQPGMKEATHDNTTGGRILRNTKESGEAGNSGYRLGQNLRRAAIPVRRVAKKTLQPVVKSLKKDKMDD